MENVYIQQRDLHFSQCMHKQTTLKTIATISIQLYQDIFKRFIKPTSSVRIELVSLFRILNLFPCLSNCCTAAVGRWMLFVVVISVVRLMCFRVNNTEQLRCELCKMQNLSPVLRISFILDIFHIYTYTFLFTLHFLFTYQKTR